MLRKELEEYLVNQGYIEEKKGSFKKKYKKFEGDDSEKNLLTIEYKFQKKLVWVIYHTYNKKIKRFRGKLSVMCINKDGNINGLQQIEK